MQGLSRHQVALQLSADNAPVSGVTDLQPYKLILLNVHTVKNNIKNNNNHDHH